jgi:energy-coupling factor transporter ATP-binding protein EcfA2
MNPITTREAHAPAGLRLAFSHLNLRFNPFGEPSDHERAGLAWVATRDLEAGETIQFVGESGRGKTTHLMALAARHPAAVYEKLQEGQDRWTVEMAEGVPFLLDEAQRAHPRRLRALLRSGRAVALGTHADLSALAPRPIRTIQVGGVGLSQIGAIVARRIEWARRSAGPVPSLSAAALAILVAKHGDDVRSLLGELYDVFQTLTEVGPVTL